MPKKINISEIPSSRGTCTEVFPMLKQLEPGKSLAFEKDEISYENLRYVKKRWDELHPNRKVTLKRRQYVSYLYFEPKEK